MFIYNLVPLSESALYFVCVQEWPSSISLHLNNLIFTDINKRAVQKQIENIKNIICAPARGK